MKTLIHLTVNTGHSIEQPKTVVSRQALDYLRPFIERGGGQLDEPFENWNVRITTTVMGAAVFSLYLGRVPVLIGTMAWDEAKTGDCWEMVLATYERWFPLDNKPVRPERAPWLAIVLAPTAAAIADSESSLNWLGDFERCLAWAIIEKYENLK